MTLAYLKRLSKLDISRVTIRVTPFKALITLLITYLLSPLPLQVAFLGSSVVPFCPFGFK